MGQGSCGGGGRVLRGEQGSYGRSGVAWGEGKGPAAGGAMQVEGSCGGWGLARSGQGWEGAGQGSWGMGTGVLGGQVSCRGTGGIMQGAWGHVGGEGMVSCGGWTGAQKVCWKEAGAGVLSDQPLTLTTTGNLIRKLPRKTAVRVGDTAMFCVELARPEGPVHWLRNQEEMVAGGRVAITTEGMCHTLTISQCSLEDVGEVTFTAGDCRTSTQFFVSGKGLGSALGWTVPFASFVHGALLCSPARCTEGFGGLNQWVIASVSWGPWFVCTLLHCDHPR